MPRPYHRTKKRDLSTYHRGPKKTPIARKTKSGGTSPHLQIIGVCQWLTIIFETNEQLCKARRMCDETIKIKLLDEYGHLSGMDAIRSGARSINYYRGLYNLGELMKEHNHRPPAILSHRYAVDGSLAKKNTGRPMAEQEAAEQPAKDDAFRKKWNLKRDRQEIARKREAKKRGGQ